jgi:quinol monooxygenase YgiN
VGLTKEGEIMAPHMTHFKMRARPGERQKVIDLFDEWARERRHEVGGFVRVVLSSHFDDPDHFMAYAMFADKATYDANSASPQQHAWFQRLRSHLVGDPDWFDATVELQRMGQV